MDRRVSLLALVLPMIYIPGYTGVSISTGWALLSGALPLATWRGANPPIPVSLQALGVAFLAYALLSLYWTPDQLTGVFYLWQLFCLTFAFLWGSQLLSLEGVAKGMALGLVASSLLAVPQALGYQPVLVFNLPAGLLFNSVILGEAIAITILLLVAYRLWWYIPLLLPGLVLSQSKGAWLPLALLGAMWLCRRHLAGYLALAGVAAAVAWLALAPSAGDEVRLGLWLRTWENLSLFGHGVGSMNEVTLLVSGNPVSPENAHNEFLDLAYQYGLMALIPILLMLTPLLAGSPVRSAYAACLIMALYSFPLHAPVTAFLFVVLAGHLCRDWDLVWHRLGDRGYGLIHRLGDKGHRADAQGSAAVPVL